MEMKKLLGNGLQEKDLEPPPNIREVHSLVFHKNASDNKDLLIISLCQYKIPQF
ncbi:hypothetical protein FH972_010891 [Carpinus fangiana]|uniref:Uncharacterized protein n=1 Tax=Carpinus fangiana TaxID=176857 RepID=A0A660KRH5_9ROSI|nr:hypothetical protein FH972_010891 [Carpinus fangiana]